jgi:outer membrane protein assembly factor BamB
MRFALRCYCVLPLLCASFAFAQMQSSEEPSLGDVARQTREQQQLKSASMGAKARQVQEPGTNIGAHEANTLIEPSEVLLPLGVSQQFQLLDAGGNELPSNEGWTVSDPTMAELTVEGGHAILLGLKVGNVTLRHDSGAETKEIRIHDRKPPMPVESRWILQPIDGEFVHALWASGSWFGRIDGADEEKDESAAAYFYEDRGGQTSHIRAIREDGLQAWQWPAETEEVPHMLCGDFYSGVLAYVGDKQNRMLISISASGKERWRVAVPGFPGRNVNVGLTGDVLLVEESPDSAGARVVVLNGRTGAEKVNFALPPSREIVRNMELRNGKAVCSPETERSRNLPAYYSDVMTNAIVSPNVTTLAYSELSVIADAGKCEPGAVLPLERIRLSAVQRLMIWDLTDEQGTKFSIVEEHAAEGNASSLGFDVAEPTGDIIVGDTGTGNFLAVRQARMHWPTLAHDNDGYFQYRVTEDRTVKYRFPVKVSQARLTSTMLLGDNNTIGYVTRGNDLVAFDTETAKELWRWKSDNTDVSACAALKGDAVIVREGKTFAVIRSGKLEDHRDPDFMLFVMKFLPNNDPQ